MASQGDTLVVGAPLDDIDGVQNAGSAYVFERNQQTGQWVQVQKLTAPVPWFEGEFGDAIAINGDWLLIGSPGASEGENFAGSVYFFIRQNGTWVFAQQRSPAVPRDSANFGNAVAFDGEWAIIGALRWDWEEEQGAVYFFENIAGSWTERARFVGSPGDNLGRSVALSADWAFAGAPNRDFGGFEDSGAVEAFHLVDGIWMQEGPLPSQPLADYEMAGWSLALEGDILLVGVREASKAILGGGAFGRVEQFEFDGTEWQSQGRIVPIDRDMGDPQGFSAAIAIDGNHALVGAPSDGNGGGAAYFFDLTGQTGTRCILTDVTVQFGTPIAVGLSGLQGSEDIRVRIRSRFGFSAQDPNLAELRIGAQNYVANPTTLDLLIEARMNQSGGTMKVRLKNWNTNSFNQVHHYSIGSAETVEPVSNLSAANYVRPSDNRIELSLRMSALATFSAQGFEAQHDFVNVLVHN